MPVIDDIIKKSTKKFKKSAYRPWNYMDELDKEETEKKYCFTASSSTKAANLFLRRKAGY